MRPHHDVGPPHAHLTYVGHATVLIEMGATRLLTDPLLRDRTLHLRRTGAMIQPGWHDALNGVLISHLHWDHFDLPSLRALRRGVPIVAPRGSGRYLAPLGFTRVHEMAAGEVVTLDGVRVTATPADHPAVMRSPNGPRIDCLGYLVEGPRRMYFAGDTDVFDAMRGLAPGLDVALLPVWGWGPRLGAGHMNPRRAAQSLQLLRPRVAVPIHWGTLHPLGMGWARPRFLEQPPLQFAQHAAELAPDVQVKIVRVGQRAQV